MNLEDRLNAPPTKGWKPQPGDMLIGTILEIGTATSTYGEYPLIVVDADGGPVAVHAFHSVLRNELKRLSPSEGDRLGIKYLGRVQGNDQTYESYTVAVERATPVAHDWGTSEPVTAGRNGGPAADELA